MAKLVLFETLAFPWCLAWDAEVGRIVGYPGEDHFWGLLGELFQRLPAQSGDKIAF